MHFGDNYLPFVFMHKSQHIFDIYSTLIKRKKILFFNSFFKLMQVLGLGLQKRDSGINLYYHASYWITLWADISSILLVFL